MKLLSLILLSLFILGGESPAQSVPDPKDGPVVVEPGIVSRLRSVNILLHGSSVVKRIEVSGNESALGHLQEAREIYVAASDLHKEGKDDDASKTLNQCVARLMLASREAKTTLDDIGYQTRLYKERLASVEALMLAHRRVATSKDVMADKLIIENQARELVAQAEAQVAEQKIPEGQILLNQAYALLRASIFSMHNGDTVHSPKEFPTIEDQYKYEVDRAQSYRMLVFALISGVTPQVVAQIERLVNSGDDLAKLADEQASKGDFKSALSSIVSASRFYARAIQVGGVYIPAA